MLLTLLPMGVFATDSAQRTPVSMSSWLAGTSGYTKDDFASIELTIGSADELAAFNSSTSPHTNLKGAYIKLTADIDYTGKTWKGIIFDGTFDGNGHTVAGINVTNCKSSPGMFRFAGGTIKNLTLINITVDASAENTSSNGESAAAVANVGAIVGSRMNLNVYDSDLIIDNVHIINGNVKGAGQVGGIIGSVNAVANDTSKNTSTTVTISNCSFNGTVKGTSNVGGIIGYCVNAGSVSVSNCSVSLEGEMGTSTAGSIIGLVNANTTVTSCTVLPSEYNPSNYANLKSGSTKTLNVSDCTSDVSASTRYYGIQDRVVDGLVDYRMVGVLDTEDLGEINDIGFYVTVTYGGVTKAQKVSCNTVYTSVQGGGITYTTKQTRSGETVIDGDYLYVLVIAGVPAEATVSATVTTYMSDADGNISCGATKTETLTQD